MPIEDKNNQPLISPEEAIRRAREAQVPQVNTSFKPETSPLNPNKNTFDARLLPEGYKFGEGVKPDATAPAPEDERSEQRRAIDELYEAAKQRVAQHPKQERLERAHALISGISDLGRSIANMYFTSQGAPNGFKFDEGMSEAARKRAEKALERREKEREAYYKYAMKGADLDYKEAKENFDREKFEREQERKDKLNDSKVKANEAMARYRDAIKNKNDALAQKYEKQIEFEEQRQEYLIQGYDDNHAIALARQKVYAADYDNKTNGTITTTTKTDEYGNTSTTTSEKRPNTAPSTQTKANDNTPPSKRKSKDSSNTPPSRRK